MMSRIFKPWLVLALIFLAGAVTGSLLTIGLRPHFMHPPGMQMMKHHWMGILTEKLGLTADQQTKIEPILTDATNKLQQLHHDEVTQAQQIMTSVNTQIAAVLTPDQQAKLQQLEADQQREFSGHQHWMHGERRQSDDGKGGGGAPPPPAPSGQ